MRFGGLIYAWLGGVLGNSKLQRIPFACGWCDGIFSSQTRTNFGYYLILHFHETASEVINFGHICQSFNRDWCRCDYYWCCFIEIIRDVFMVWYKNWVICPKTIKIFLSTAAICNKHKHLWKFSTNNQHDCVNLLCCGVAIIFIDIVLLYCSSFSCSGPPQGWCPLYFLQSFSTPFFLGILFSFFLFLVHIPQSS